MIADVLPASQEHVDALIMIAAWIVIVAVGLLLIDAKRGRS